MMATAPALGIYEKALPTHTDWSARLQCVADAGYGFVELAIDEDEERLARLHWTAQHRAQLRQAMASTGVPVRTLILSAHRRFPLGSANIDTRRTALDLLERAVDLAVDIGARLVQLAGYFVYFEDHDAGSRQRFVDGLRDGLRDAAPAGVMLGLETMDGSDIVSVATAMEVVREIDSPWLQVYPDLGNLAANGIDVQHDLEAGRGHLVGVHLKDTRPGEYRRVPFGEGIVPFTNAFATLERIGYDGPFVVEMWNDGEPDPLRTITLARQWLERRMADSRL